MTPDRIPDGWDQLVRRLDRLECENRWWRRVAGAATLGLAAVGLIGQALPRTVPGVIEAERVVLRDRSGTTRAALGLAPDGSAGLALADRDGRLRASLTVGTDGAPALGLFDQDEKNRAALTVSASGSASLSLYDRRGEPRAGFIVPVSGSPEVVLQKR